MSKIFTPLLAKIKEYCKANHYIILKIESWPGAAGTNNSGIFD